MQTSMKSSFSMASSFSRVICGAYCRSISTAEQARKHRQSPSDFVKLSWAISSFTECVQLQRNAGRLYRYIDRLVHNTFGPRRSKEKDPTSCSKVKVDCTKKAALLEQEAKSKGKTKEEKEAEDAGPLPPKTKRRPIERGKFQRYNMVRAS